MCFPVNSLLQLPIPASVLQWNEHTPAHELLVKERGPRKHILRVSSHEEDDADGGGVDGDAMTHKPRTKPGITEPQRLSLQGLRFQV